MKILKYQQWHLLCLVVLIASIYFYAKTDPTFLNGELFGLSTSIWFIIALLSPIVHQLYVLICWRTELTYRSITKVFGTMGFKLYKLGFAILIFSRLITIILLAISNANSLALNSVLAYVLASILSIPSFYLFYSVKRYFGMDRAFGVDHFRPEEMKDTPFVRQGIFKYTSNGMYIFGFLLLWIPGLLFLSKAAVIVALFNHMYIWVHYYFTELPDIKFIYKE